MIFEILNQRLAGSLSCCSPAPPSRGESSYGETNSPRNTAIWPLRIHQPHLISF